MTQHIPLSLFITPLQQYQFSKLQIDIAASLSNNSEENMQHQMTSLNGSSKHTQINTDLPTSTFDAQKQLTTLYQQQLEAQLVQKAERGEDVQSCINALNYFANQNKQLDLLNKVYTDAKKELSVFNSVQRVTITVFAILGMIGVFSGAFNQVRQTPTSVAPSVQVP